MTDGGSGRGLVWGAAALALVLLAVQLLGGSSPAPPVEVASGTAGEGAAGDGGGHTGPERASGPYVHVAGAVRSPGLYRLPAGARVESAIERAGGPRRRADLDAINLAARVVDGQQVLVPAAGAPRGARRAGGRVDGPAGGADGPISLGSATAAELEQLDGIGPTLAARIVDHRRELGGYAAIEQLDDVEGIGEARLEALSEALVP